jgi:hypothetical protein
MRIALLLGCAAGLAAGCGDYFDGSDLYFTFDQLAPLQTLTDADRAASAPGACADDAYLAQHPDEDQQLEYNAWATLNGGPVLIARFTVRECTFVVTDTDVKKAVTSVRYSRDPDGYPDPKTGSALYGVVNGIANALPSGGVAMKTDVRLDGASEIFVTREPVGRDPATATPTASAVLMEGDLVATSGVLKATLTKRLGGASGAVTVVVVDRSPEF